jgi:hypothetical protein
MLKCGENVVPPAAHRVMTWLAHGLQGGLRFGSPLTNAWLSFRSDMLIPAPLDLR